MANKNVLIATLGLATVAGLTMVVGKAGNKSMPAHLRKPVLEASKTAEITLIELKKGDQTLNIARGADNIWYLGETSSGKPAAVNQVVQLLDDLTRARFDQVVGAEKDGVADYGLATPTLVSLTAKDQQVTQVNLGSARSGGGQYVLVPNDPSIYLTARLVQVNLDESSWLAPTPPPAESRPPTPPPGESGPAAPVTATPPPAESQPATP